MKNKKEQWKPKVTNLRKMIVDGEEQWVEFDTDGFVIPAGHPYYDIAVWMHKEAIQKGA